MSDFAWWLRWQAGVVLAVCLGYALPHAAGWPDWSMVVVALAAAPLTILGALNARL